MPEPFVQARFTRAQYYALEWCRSVYTCLIDSFINGALRIVTGCSSNLATD